MKMSSDLKINWFKPLYSRHWHAAAPSGTLSLCAAWPIYESTRLALRSDTAPGNCPECLAIIAEAKI